MTETSLVTKELLELKAALTNAAQNTEKFSAKQQKSPECIVNLSQALYELKSIQIRLKDSQK